MKNLPNTLAVFLFGAAAGEILTLILFFLVILVREAL